MQLPPTRPHTSIHKAAIRLNRPRVVAAGTLRYKDPAVVELLRTKCAAGKTERALRAKTMQNLDALMTGRLEADRLFLGPYLADKDEQAAGSET